MRISELSLWLLNHCIVIELLCPQRAAPTRKLPQNRTNRKMKRDKRASKDDEFQQ